MTKNNNNKELWWHKCRKITYCLKYWSATLIMEKKPSSFKKRKSASPPPLKDQGCSCKQSLCDKLAETSYHQILHWT